eukprot:12919516-Prorocentrum_lima.AAC.1
MAWITHRTIQQDQSCRPEVQVPGILMDAWEYDAVAHQNVYNLYLEDNWMTLSTIRVDGDEAGDQTNRSYARG